MKEIKIPAECEGAISKYDNMPSADMLWLAFKGRLNPNDKKLARRIGYDITQELAEKQTSEMETDGLLERTRTRRFLILPQEKLRPTIKGRYVLYALLNGSYEKMFEEWDSRGKEESWPGALSNMQDENSFLIQRYKAEEVANTLA